MQLAQETNKNIFSYKKTPSEVYETYPILRFSLLFCQFRYCSAKTVFKKNLTWKKSHHFSSSLKSTEIGGRTKKYFNQSEGDGPEHRLGNH
jgi:hypothetical protein